jgi:hypothetical protein
MDPHTLFRLVTLAVEGALLQFLSYRDEKRARKDLHIVLDAIIAAAVPAAVGTR